MANIQVTPEMLQSKAGELRKLKQNHDSNMQAMRSLIMGLDQIWKGESQAAFTSKYESMKSTFDSFSNMLEQYAQLMDTTAKTFTETDNSLKSSIQSFG